MMICFLKLKRSTCRKVGDNRIDVVVPSYRKTCRKVDGDTNDVVVANYCKTFGKYKYKSDIFLESTAASIYV